MSLKLATPLNIEIRTMEEREIALNLVQKLSGAPEDTPEESRLVMLIEAIEIWDSKHGMNEADPNARKNAPVPWIAEFRDS